MTQPQFIPKQNLLKEKKIFEFYWLFSSLQINAKSLVDLLPILINSFHVQILSPETHKKSRLLVSQLMKSKNRGTRTKNKTNWSFGFPFRFSFPSDERKILLKIASEISIFYFFTFCHSSAIPWFHYKTAAAFKGSSKKVWSIMVRVMILLSKKRGRMWWWHFHS